MGEAVAAFYAVLARYTLEDLVRNREQLATILFLPAAGRPAEDAAGGTVDERGGPAAAIMWVDRTTLPTSASSVRLKGRAPSHSRSARYSSHCAQALQAIDHP